jgi:hypothetical protein
MYTATANGSLRQHFDSTVVQDRWLRPSLTTGLRGPSGRSEPSHACGRTPSVPPIPPALDAADDGAVGLSMPVSHSLAASTARAAMAPQTTTLRIRRPSLSLIVTRRTPTDAHDCPRDAHRPLSVNRCCVSAQTRAALPRQRDSSRLPLRPCWLGCPRMQSSRWPACEGRPSLGNTIQQTQVIAPRNSRYPPGSTCRGQEDLYLCMQELGWP